MPRLTGKIAPEGQASGPGNNRPGRRAHPGAPRTRPCCSRRASLPRGGGAPTPINPRRPPQPQFDPIRAFADGPVIPETVPFPGLPPRFKDEPGAETGYSAPANRFFQLPVAQTGHFAPGNRFFLLPVAQNCHFAPGNRYSLLPGAQTCHFAPGIRYFLSPGAENSFFAPGYLPKSSGEGIGKHRGGTGATSNRQGVPQ